MISVSFSAREIRKESHAEEKAVRAIPLGPPLRSAFPTLSKLTLHCNQYKRRRPIARSERREGRKKVTDRIDANIRSARPGLLSLRLGLVHRSRDSPEMAYIKWLSSSDEEDRETIAQRCFHESRSPVAKNLSSLVEAYVLTHALTSAGFDSCERSVEKRSEPR